MSDGLSIVHVAPRVQARGGIETLLALYAGLPGRQSFVALFDRHPAARAGYANLDLRWHTTLGTMRRRFAAALAPHAGQVVVWHNGWGFPLLAPLERAARRVVFLHADPAYHAPDLPAFRGCVDGVAGIVPSLDAFCRAGFPELEDARRAMIGIPVEQLPAPARDFGARPLVLGYAGRLERAQKRLDRLEPFLDALARRGVECRFEVLGEGAYGATLRRRLGGRVKFHGWLPREAMIRVLGGWHGAVYFSDHEAGPIALLEAMSAGAIPFYPAHGGSWGDIHAPRVDARCHYPAGDVAAAAAAVAEVFARPVPELQQLSARARALVQAHAPAQHVAATAEFLARIAGLPPVARQPRPRRRWADALPLGFVTRFAPRLLRG